MRATVIISSLLRVACAAFICVLPALTPAQTPALDTHVERQGVSLHYKVFGTSGDYVLLLAGGPGSTVEYMQPVANALRRSHRVVMLEQRGTGRSNFDPITADSVKMEQYVEDVEAVRRHLRARRVHLVGNSWGMMLALLYASQYPDHVDRVVTVGSVPISDKHAAIADDNFRVRLLPDEREVRNKWRDRMRTDPSLYQQGNYEREKAGTPAYYYDRAAGLKAASVLKQDDFNYRLMDEFFGRYETFDIRPNLRKVKAPVLLIHGRQDFTGESNIIEAQSLIKGSKLTFIERCGHIPWEEHPAQTFKLITDFLAKAAR